MKQFIRTNGIRAGTKTAGIVQTNGLVSSSPMGIAVSKSATRDTMIDNQPMDIVDVLDPYQESTIVKPRLVNSTFDNTINNNNSLNNNIGYAEPIQDSKTVNFSFKDPYPKSNINYSNSNYNSANYNNANDQNNQGKITTTTVDFAHNTVTENGRVKRNINPIYSTSPVSTNPVSTKSVPIDYNFSSNNYGSNAQYNDSGRVYNDAGTVYTDTPVNHTSSANIIIYSVLAVIGVIILIVIIIFIWKSYNKKKNNIYNRYSDIPQTRITREVY